MITEQEDVQAHADDVTSVPLGYKRTDLGVIPEDWGCDRLSDLVIRVGSGITPTGGERVYTLEGRPFLRSQNVGWGELHLDDLAFIDEETHASFAATEVQEGDVLLNITGASIGRSAVADTRVARGNVNQHVCEIRTDQRKLDPYFLSNYLLSAMGQRQIDSFQAGGNRQGLNYSQIRSFLIPRPRVQEQRAIAAALADADGLIRALGVLIAKKRAIKQATMQQLLTGKTRLPGFERQWQKKRLRDLLCYERPEGYIVRSTEYAEQGDVPVLTANKSFVLGFTSELFGVCRSLPAVIFDDFTTDMKYVTFPFKIKSSAIKILRAKSDEVNLYFLFERMRLIRFPIGDHKRYYISEFQDIELPVPDRDEQGAVATVLSDIDQEIAGLERRRDKTMAVKQGMMQALLTGRIRLVKPSAGQEVKA